MFNIIATWMCRLVTTVSSYDKELVVVEEDTDPGTSFLVAATYRSRSAAVICSSADVWLGRDNARRHTSW
jgi:hypothetical protein